jgi:hypothetical protein
MIIKHALGKKKGGAKLFGVAELTSRAVPFLEK